MASFEETVQRIADSLEPSLRATYLRAIAAARAEFPVDLLAESPELLDAYDRVIGAYDDMGTVLDPAPMTAALQAGFTDTFPQGIPPYATRWTEEHAGLLITGISDPARDAIRAILTTSSREHIDPRRTAILLRDHIGALPAHQTAAARYLSSLLDAGFSEAQADYFHSVYTTRLRAWRADMIARTESIRAANMAQVLLWAEQARKGLIDPYTAVVYWIVTRDDRLCPYCAPMDGQEVLLVDLMGLVGVFGPEGLMGAPGFRSTHKGFPDGRPRRGLHRALKPDPFAMNRDSLGRFITKRASGRTPALTRLPKERIVLCPPLHPQCRCALGLRIAR